MPGPAIKRITLDDIKTWKAQNKKFSMLTAYDFPMARAAHEANVPTLLIGDSMGNVVLGQDTTRDVPFELMLILGKAVRLGAPNAYLIGDIPFVTTEAGKESVVEAGRRYRDEVGCDSVKVEAAPEHADYVRALADAGVDTIAHLGLRPQSVTSPDGYKAQARDDASIAELVEQSVSMVDAGAVMLLLEAVTPQASEAVVAAVDVPVIGCGGGPACDGHVVVTHDMLGNASFRPPKFVDVLEHIHDRTVAAMKQYVDAVTNGDYPAKRHQYGMKK